MEPIYEVWTADLNSLYEDQVRPAVFAEDCFSFDEATKAVKDYQSNDMAAWILDKNTNEIVC